MLREDNADARLTEQGRKIGLVDNARWQHFCEKQEAISQEEQRLKSTWVQAGSAEATQLAPKLKSPLSREYSLMDLLRRPELEYGDIAELPYPKADISREVSEQVQISAKYAGYIERQMGDIEKLRQNENTLIPEDFPYDSVEGLSNEVKQKLKESLPGTLAQASRIPGVTPAAVSLLLVYLKKHGLLRKQSA